jgi:hypothetical protein
MNPTDEIYLSFTNEKYEIVSYLRNEVLQHSVSDKIFLEFKDRPEPNLDQYQTPYIVHWHQHYDFSDLKKLKNCIGICFNEQFLRDLQVTHDYFAIVEQIINLKTSLKMKIMLELNQTSLELPTGKDITLDSTRTILNGLTQELEIDIVSVNIHKGLETRYRDIDVNMLKNAAKMSVNMFQE